MKVRRPLRDWLSSQRALVGFLQAHANPALAELAGMCGYDFLLLDCEHGVFSETDHLQTLRALGSSETAAWIRLAGHDLRALGRYLDMGADGIVVPDVRTAEQARALVGAMDYPPKGSRGFGAGVHRATRYGMDVQSHIEFPRGGACLLVIIESTLGVANAEEILAVDGVDGAFVGPSDLSASLGQLGEFSSSAYAEAMIRIERAAAATGKVVGTGPHSGYPLEALLTRGHRLLIVGADIPLIREAMFTQVSTAKSCLRPSS